MTMYGDEVGDGSGLFKVSNYEYNTVSKSQSSIIQNCFVSAVLRCQRDVLYLSKAILPLSYYINNKSSVWINYCAPRLYLYRLTVYVYMFTFFIAYTVRIHRCFLGGLLYNIRLHECSSVSISSCKLLICLSSDIFTNMSKWKFKKIVSKQEKLVTLQNIIYRQTYAKIYRTISPKKEQLVLTHQYTILQRAEKNWPRLYRPNLQHVMFSRIYKNRQTLWTQHFDRRCDCNPAA